jgi:FkbM family methyltransferase
MRPYEHIQGGNVPGGHNVISNRRPGQRPFITPVRELNSIELRHSDVVVDIGAYVGTYALRCARFPVQRVIAYEPTPDTHAILSLSAGLPNLDVRQAAVVGVAGDTDEVELHISSGIGVTNSVALSNRKASSVLVPAVPYEEAVRGASVVKIDVEGLEYDYQIAQPSLRAVLIDFHPVPGLDWVGLSRDIIRDLEAAGFEAVITPDFANGWTRAGSWIRPMETAGRCDALMDGDQCCGCGLPINARAKALCPDCWASWMPRHRDGFARAE